MYLQVHICTYRYPQVLIGTSRSSHVLTGTHRYLHCDSGEAGRQPGISPLQSPSGGRLRNTSSAWTGERYTWSAMARLRNTSSTWENIQWIYIFNRPGVARPVLQTPSWFINWLIDQVTHPLKKSRIRETPTLSTDADSRTDTNLKRLHDLSNFVLFIFFL